MSGGQAIYVILNLFQDLVVRCTDVKRQRSETSIVPLFPLSGEGLRERGATHVALPNRQHRAAFTLAEVLITLGIIGVVAAMTLPILISHHRAKVFESQLKKAYSSISNATRMLVAQGISPYDDFSYDNDVSQRAEILMNQTKTYAKIMLGTVCEKDNINTKCGTSGSEWKNLTGAGSIHRGAISAEKAFMLNDGTCILIGNYHWFIVDINGPKKGPNRVGYDIHTFKITEDNNVKPVPEGDHDTRICTLSSKESTDIYLGYGCTPYAVMNKNPDGDGDYWHDFLGL